MTSIDTAHAAMESSPNDDAARLRFFERIADAELFVLLEAEPTGDDIAPRLFRTGQGGFVLAFDREDRLAGFAGGPAPYAAMSGRAIAAMLAGQDIGLGLNLDVAPSSILIPPGALSWLAATLGAPLEEDNAAAAEFTPPSDLPDRLIESLDAKAAAGSYYPLIYPSTMFCCTSDCMWYLEVHPKGPHKMELIHGAVFPKKTVERDDFDEVVKKYYGRWDQTAIARSRATATS